MSRDDDVAAYALGQQSCFPVPAAEWERINKLVKTKHGWARPCSACGSTNAGKPCAKTKDGFHV